MQDRLSTIGAMWVATVASGILGGHARADTPQHSIDASIAHATRTDARPRPASHHQATHHGNHLSALAGTTTHNSETASTYGLDYEFRLDELIGIGAVAEHAVAPLETTTLLAVADVHLWRALAVQTGPGAEFLHDAQEAASGTQVRFVYRVGVLYEFVFGRATISPQLHYDMVPGTSNDSVVAALAFGMGF